MCIRQVATTAAHNISTSAHLVVSAAKSLGSGVISRIQSVFSLSRVLRSDILTPAQARQMTRPDPQFVQRYEEGHVCRLYARFLEEPIWSRKVTIESQFRATYDSYVERSLQREMEPKTLAQLGLDEGPLQVFYRNRDINQHLVAGLDGNRNYIQLSLFSAA